MKKRQYDSYSPCYVCESRHGYCHSHCEKYKEYREQLKRLAKARADKVAVDDVEINTRFRLRKKKNTRRLR